MTLSSHSGRPQPVGLSIAGSDSGGGAGIQMDLRTMHRLGVFGATAITAITAQNLDGVRGVAGTAPSLLAAQLDAVLEGFAVRAIKTGMLWSAALVEVVTDKLRGNTVPLVVDPVMVATSGARLLDDHGIAAYDKLWARATLATPNLDEAAVLLGHPLDPADLDTAAQRLADKLGCAVLLKGGHLVGPPRDVLVTPTLHAAWVHDRIDGANTHGSGCMLSAAIAARLALGDALVDACEAGLAFTHDALERGAARGPRGLAAVEHATTERAHLRRDA